MAEIEFRKARQVALAKLARHQLHDLWMPMYGMESASEAVAEAAAECQTVDRGVASLLTTSVGILSRRIHLMRVLLTAGTHFELLGKVITNDEIETMRQLCEGVKIVDRPRTTLEQRLCIIIAAYELENQIRVHSARRKIASADWSVTADPVGAVCAQSDNAELLSSLHGGRFELGELVPVDFLRLARDPDADVRTFLFTSTITYFALLAGWHVLSTKLRANELTFEFSTLSK